MSQKHASKNKNVVVWDADSMQNEPASNRGVVRILERKSLVRTTNNPVTTQTRESRKIASTTMRRTIAANKSVAVNESTIQNTMQSGKVQSSPNLTSGARVKTRATDRRKENGNKHIPEEDSHIAIHDQHMLISRPPTNIVPPKRSSRKVYDSTEEDLHPTASSGTPRLGIQHLRKGKEILQVDNDVDNGQYIIDAHFRENQMLVYEQPNLVKLSEVEYEDYEILNDEVLPTGQGQDETYHSDDVGQGDDGAESDTVGEDDENNNSLNNSNDDYEPVEKQRNKVSTSHERQIEPINSDIVGMSGNGGRNSCCDRCKDVNGILLRKLNEIIELLNASNCKIGESNKNVDFSRLGNFPLQSVKDVENFEKQLKEDSSLMELYKMKICRIGGDNPTLAIRSALKTIIADEVAQRYSWTGLKQTIKFSQHKIIDGIIETVMKRGDTTLTELQNTAKEWLRHAGDRVRYQQKKELKTLEK